MAYLPNTTRRRNTGQGGLVVLLSGTLLINLGALSFLGFGDLLSTPEMEADRPADEGLALIDSAPQTPSPPRSETRGDVPVEVNESVEPEARIDLPVSQAEDNPSPQVEVPVDAPEAIPPVVTLPLPAAPVVFPEEQSPPETPIEFFGIGLE